MVWVEDAATTALWPFCLGPEFAAWCNGLTPGQPPQRELPANIRWVLWQAEVLVPPNHAALRRHAWLTTVAKAAPAFERGYVALPNLMPAFHLGALRRFYRAQTRAGALPYLNDEAGPRFLGHDDAVARFVHRQLATAASDVARAVLQPSSCATVCYQSGAHLETQTAPEPCEYTLSLCFDTTPEPEAQSPWPFQIDTAEGRLKLWQYLGDALLYRARYIPHARDPLPQGHTSSSLLFHYTL